MTSTRRWIVSALTACLSATCAFAADDSRYIVADFEDISTWRTGAVAGVPSTAWFSGGMFLGSSGAEKCADQFVGEIRYAFVEGSGNKEIVFERVRASETSAFIDAIEFQGNPKGIQCALSFELMDAAGKRFRTDRVAMEGSEWKTYRIDINDKTVRDYAKMKSPAKLRRVFFSSSEQKAVSGSAFIDNITLVGAITRERKVSIWPIYRRLNAQPGKPVQVEYRVRNASPEVRTVAFDLQAQNSFGQRVGDVKKDITIKGYGQEVVSIDLGRLPIGPYGLTAKVTGQGVKAEITDWVGVFEPVGGRTSTRGMLFGIGDQTMWQCDEENTLHIQWMKQLGIDMNRFGTTGGRIEPQPGLSGTANFDKWIRAHEQAGIDIQVMYMDVPSWTQTKPTYRMPPDDYEAFARHAEFIGQFVARHPNIKYFEFWNEPELDFYRGSLDDFIKMLSAVHDGIKKYAPDVKIGTGSQTGLDHPKHKKGFEDLFFRAKDKYDVAMFHSHGTTDRYVHEHEWVAGFLKQHGISKPLGNTESGERAGYAVPGGWNQAETLVRKMVYARAQGTEFFMWFTLQDYWDMDFGADDSFGLITADNHPKPSCLAYNEMVRQLASTLPAAQVQLHSDVVTYAFTNPDTQENIYVCWPLRDGLPVTLTLSGAPIVSVVDLYGRPQRVGQVEDTSFVIVAKSPVYIRTKAGSLKRVETNIVEYSREVALVPDGQTVLPVKVKNVWNKAADFSLSVLNDADQTLSTQKIKLAAGETGSVSLAVSLPKGEQSLGSRQYQLKLETGAGSSLDFPLAVFTCYGVAKKENLSAVEKVVPISLQQRKIEVNSLTDVHEITHDPAIPQWAGPKDLSIIAVAEHDEKGILFSFDVTDDKHVPSQNKETLWVGDNIQLAIATPTGQIVEYNLGLPATGPVAWCALAPEKKDLGEANIPLQIKRDGDVTRYRVYVPYEKIGMGEASARGKSFRFAFLVNENDGQGRVRWMHWFDGIGKSKNASEFGYGLLE